MRGRAASLGATPLRRRLQAIAAPTVELKPGSFARGFWRWVPQLENGMRRVRFTTSHPRDFTKDIVEAIEAVPALCDHVHLPVQSGSDRSDDDYALHCTALASKRAYEIAGRICFEGMQYRRDIGHRAFNRR